MSKKRTLAVLSAIAIGTCVLSGFITRPYKSSADEQSKVYSNLFDYSESELTLTENFTSNKVSDGKSGVLISSVKSGNEAEGASFTYKGVLNGTFETEFRVLSEKSYQGADGLTYTHSVNGWDTSKPSQSATLYAADSFNPYMDLKEVAFKFTSNTNSDAWFIVYVRGGYSAGRADLSSARVFTSTDNANFSMGFSDSLDGIALKGYGLVGNDGWPSASWDSTNGAEYSMLSGAFSNTVVSGNSTASTFKFDPETMQIYQNESWELIRDLSSNAKVASAYQSNFGTLSKEDFAGGYTVSVEFTDVTANTTVAGDISGITTWGDFGYGETNAQYKTFDATYDRYANLVLYNFGGKTLFSDETVGLKSTPVTVGDVSLDANKFVDGASALHLTTSKTGNAAEGTAFYVNHEFAGDKNFEIDFRVYSEKSYSSNTNYTHSVNTWETSRPSQSATLYAADCFNPYMDLREVAFKFTSKTNSNAWFIVYIRGGYASGRADLSSARVFTSTDNASFSMGFSDSLDQKLLKGYGLVGNDGWPAASWAATNGADYTMMGGAFSNTVVNGTSASSMFKFDPVNMQVLGYNGGYGLVRDLTSNDRVASGYQSNFGTLSANDFAGGYTVSMEFTDVTANTTVAGDISGITTWGEFGYGEADAQYNTFDTAYDRYANMLVYGIKEGDVALSISPSLIVDSSAFNGNAYANANKNFKTEVGKTVDVTPVVKDVKLGDIAYNGTVTWTNLKDNTNGVVEAVEGKYNFTPATCGKYLVNYGEMIPYTSAFAVTFEAYAYGDLVGAKQATCTEDGNIAYYYCEACDKYYDENKNEVDSEDVVLSASGHAWADANCDTPKTCSVCSSTEGEALGHSYGDWVVTKDPTATEAGSQQKTCSVCGDVVTEEIPVTNANGVRYVSISTAGDIGLNFYVYLSDATDTTATVTMNGNSVQVEGAYQESLDCWKYTYGVAPKDYKVKVTLTVLDVTVEYSVADYATALPEENEAYDIVTQLMKYCEAARVYFAGETATATEDLTEDLSKYAATVIGAEENVTIAGATLVLEAKTTVNVYITAESLDGITCTVNKKTVTPVALEDQDGQYVISISGIVAKDLDEVYTITVGGYTIKYCALSYVEETLSGTVENIALSNLVKALYSLSVEAEEYFKVTE